MSGEGHGPDKFVRLATVEECDEKIAQAQEVLDDPAGYDIEVRVDAAKSKRRWQRERQYAAELARVEAELGRLERLRDDLASDALDLRLMLKDNADLAEAEIERRDRELARLKGGLRRIDSRLTTAEGDNVTRSYAAVVHVRQIARSLLAAGRDDVVGMLALGRSAPEREGYVLTTPMDTGGLTDSDRARREIAIRRSAHEEPGQ